MVLLMPSLGFPSYIKSNVLVSQWNGRCSSSGGPRPWLGTRADSALPLRRASLRDNAVEGNKCCVPQARI